MKICRLTQNRIGDWLDFFDHRAFCDNPSLQTCYCTYFYSPKQPIASCPKPTNNRDYAQQLIRAGFLAGYLVYDDNKVVIGWCGVNQKAAFFRTSVSHSTLADDSSANKTIAIMCFVIDPEHRGKGMTAKIVSRIIRDAKKSGVSRIEAYPRQKARTSAGAFHGGYSMYKNLGFVDLECDGKKIVSFYC